MLNLKKNRMKKHTFCRFSILLSIILVFLLYPMSSMGAQKYISVKGEDMTIKQAIQLIEKTVNTRSFIMRQIWKTTRNAIITAREILKKF